MVNLTLDWKRVAKLGTAGLAAIPVFFLVWTASLAYLYTQAVLYPGCQGDRASLAEYGYEAEPVEFPSRDGPVLHGWLTRGLAHPEVVLVVLPGHAGNSRFALDDALMLTRAGYSTLIYEHRSCANPELAASTGVFEASDLSGAVDYLKMQPDIKHVGVMGFSEGGTAALLAAARDEAIEAVVAIGGYASLRADILNLGDPPQGWYDQLIRRFVLWTMLAEGIPVGEASPVDVIGRIGPRPVFLIYGEYEQGDGLALYAAASEPKDLWIVPNAGHAGYRAAKPDEYEQRIPAFFDSAFDMQPYQGPH